jgi:hypothetical protein
MQYGCFTQDFSVTVAAAGAGGILSIANPEGEILIIKRVLVYISHASTAAGTMDIGIAAGATTLDDTLLDGLSFAATGVFDNVTDKGSNGLGKTLWPVASYLTASKASGATGAEVALAGRIYVEYYRTA